MTENQRLKVEDYHTNGGVKLGVYTIVRVLSSDLAGGRLLPMRHYTKATSAPTYYLRYQGTSGLIYALQH